jgi:hypothetical protein
VKSESYRQAWLALSWQHQLWQHQAEMAYESQKRIGVPISASAGGEACVAKA